MSTETMLRLFIGVKIPVNQEILDCQRDFRNNLKSSRISWVAPNIMHITLEFLGDTPESKIPALLEKLKQAACGLSPFQSKASGCGIFGHPSSPKVLWIGMTEEKSWRNFHHEVTKEIGGQASDKAFHPHLTLARFKDFGDSKETLENGLKKYFQHTFLETEINQFQLFQSTLTPRGPIYKTIESFQLKGT